MSKPIEAGCWAVIYKPMPCCGNTTRTSGVPFVVTTVEKLSFAWCPFCGEEFVDHAAAMGLVGDSTRGAPLEICKRIDDPAAEESTETCEVLTA